MKTFIKENWLITCLIITIILSFRYCSDFKPKNEQNNDTVKILQSKISDLQYQNKTIEAHAYKLDLELQKAKGNTKTKIVEILRYKIVEQENYFKDNYNAQVKIDSVTSSKIIVDLENGKGAIKENEILTSIVKSKDSSIVILKQENNLLFDVSKINENNFKAQKNKTTFWKIATVAGIIGTILIVK